MLRRPASTTNHTNAATKSYFDKTNSELQRLGLLHLRQCAHLGEHVRRQFTVDPDQRDGAAARCFAPDMEGRDMLMLASPKADEKRPMKPGLSRLCDVDLECPNSASMRNALDVDDARPAVANTVRTPPASRPWSSRHRDQAFVIALGVARHLLDHEPRSFATIERGDDVDVFRIGRSKPAMAARSAPCVHLRHGALVGELHLVDAVSSAGGERAEPFRKRDEGLQAGRFFTRDRGKVHRVGDRAAQKINPTSARRSAGRRFPAPSLVAAPRCGVHTTWEREQRIAGRRLSTTRRRPAPAPWPLFSASYNAASSTSRRGRS